MKILVIGYNWYGLFQRAQQLTVQFARSNTVAYWQNLDYWGRVAIDVLRGRAKWRGLAEPVTPPSERNQASDLRVVSMPQFVPYRVRDALRAVNRQLVWLQARLTAGALPQDGYDAAILTTYDAADVATWEQMRARVRVYDCCDDSVHFFPPGSAAAEAVAQTEARILRSAHLVLASAPRLAERLSKSHGHVILVPNGVDAEHFAPGRALPVPSELAGVTGPVLGFTGAIEPWIDVGLIAQTADRLPDFTVMLVGPVGVDDSALRTRKNVILVGRKQYSELPAFLHRFDVCMVPFVDNELTKSVDPVKFYEYCAAGRPVVSTPMPTMVARREIVYLASTPDEFAAQVRRARQEDAPGSRERRIRLARENSWSARAARIITSIEALIDRDRRA